MKYPWDKKDKENGCQDCKHPREPIRPSRCVLREPLMMVIPPEGVHLTCPEHPEGHHVYGPQVSM